MSSVSPSQASAGEEITAAKINTPVNQLAAGINSINDAQIVDVSGTKITDGTITAAKMDTATNIETRFNESFGDFIASGCVWSLSSGLNGTMTAGVAYIDGKRVVVSAISSRAFTASKDTYVSVTNAGVVTYSETTNGGTAPSLPSNSTWIAIVVTSGAAITSVDDISAKVSDSRFLARRKLGLAGDSIVLSNIPARKFLRVVMETRAAGGTIDMLVTFNGDTANNYAIRISTNGGADSTSVSRANLSLAPSTAAVPNFAVMDVLNVASVEKAVYAVTTGTNTAGAGTAPERRELAGKWSNTSAQITSIMVSNGSGTGDFAAGSEVVVFGHD